MRKFTDEFKKAAIARVEKGEKIKDVVVDLKIHPSLLYSWRADGKKKSTGKNVKYPPAIRAKALKLLAIGKMSQSEIAAQLKVTSAIVHYWNKQNNKKNASDEAFNIAARKGAAAANGAGVEKRDVRDAMVFFKNALKYAKQKGMDPWTDPVLININHGILLLGTKV